MNINVSGRLRVHRVVLIACLLSHVKAQVNFISNAEGTIDDRLASFDNRQTSFLQRSIGSEQPRSDQMQRSQTNEPSASAARARPGSPQLVPQRRTIEHVLQAPPLTTMSQTLINRTFPLETKTAERESGSNFQQQLHDLSNTQPLKVLSRTSIVNFIPRDNNLLLKVPKNNIFGRKVFFSKVADSTRSPDDWPSLLTKLSKKNHFPKWKIPIHETLPHKNERQRLELTSLGLKHEWYNDTFTFTSKYSRLPSKHNVIKHSLKLTKLHPTPIPDSTLLRKASFGLKSSKSNKNTFKFLKITTLGPDFVRDDTFRSDSNEVFDFRANYETFSNNFIGRNNEKNIPSTTKHTINFYLNDIIFNISDYFKHMQSSSDEKDTIEFQLQSLKKRIPSNELPRRYESWKNNVSQPRMVDPRHGTPSLQNDAQAPTKNTDPLVELAGADKEVMLPVADPHLLYLQRSPPLPRHIPPSSYQSHTLFKPRLSYHLQYVSDHQQHTTVASPRLENFIVSSTSSVRRNSNVSDIVLPELDPTSNNTNRVSNNEHINRSNALQNVIINNSLSVFSSEELSSENILTSGAATVPSNSVNGITSVNKSNIMRLNNTTLIASTANTFENTSIYELTTETQMKANCLAGSCSDRQPAGGPTTDGRSKVRTASGLNNYSSHYQNLENYKIFYSRNFDLFANDSNIIYNSNIVHPFQQHQQFKHEQEMLLKQHQNRLESSKDTSAKDAGITKLNDKYKHQYNTKAHQHITKAHQHNHQHHHHALLPPSLQLPPPYPSIDVPPYRTPSITPPPSISLFDSLPSYFNFNEGGTFFHRPIWGYWYFWLGVSLVVCTVTGTCGYCRQRKIYESSSSQTVGTTPVPGTSNPGSGGTPHFLPFRVPGSSLPQQLGFTFFPPPAESPSLTSTSPMYGPPLPFLPPALYATLAPPPYSEATSSSYERLNTLYHSNDTTTTAGRGIYEYYDRRHPNAYYERYFPPANNAADDTSSSDTTSLLSYRLHRSFSVHLPARPSTHTGPRRRCDLPPPPPYSEVAAKPELYPVVVMKTERTSNNHTPASVAGSHGTDVPGLPDDLDTNDTSAPANNVPVRRRASAAASYGRRRSVTGLICHRAGRTSIDPPGSIMAPYYHYGYVSGSVSTPEGSQCSGGGGASSLPHQSATEWWRARGRVSPLLISQLASPASSPLPSDVSSPPPTRPPSPPAPTSPSASPFHFSKRHQGQLGRQSSESSSKGAELKDLLQKINQLSGVPTPPSSPAISVTNSNVSSNAAVPVPPTSPRETPSPSTAASTPSVETGSTRRKLAKLASKGLPIDMCKTHSLMHKSRYRSQKSYFQSLHFPRSRRKSLQYLRSPQSSSGSSTPAQSFKSILMQSPQTVLQSPHSSNSSSQNLQACAESSKSCSSRNKAKKNNAGSPQAVLQSPQTPQSPQSHLLSWSLSTPNLAVLTAPLIQYPQQQFAALFHQQPSGSRQHAYPSYLQYSQPCYVSGMPHHSSIQRQHPFPYLREESPLEAEEDEVEKNSENSSRYQHAQYNRPYSLNTIQNFGDLQHLTNVHLPSSISTSSGHFQSHYPQQTLPTINQNVASNDNRVSSNVNFMKREQEVLEEEDEERHVYTNVDLPQRLQNLDR